MSETLSRRNVLVTIASAAAVTASVSEADAQHVHQAIAAQSKAAAGGPFKPAAFNDHEVKTLRVLCELIVPGAASKGGAVEYIDLLSSHNAELKAIYTGGIAWMDRQMETRVQKSFVDASADDQKAFLDIIAYRRNAKDYGAGVRFFDWARRMTVDAYYTSAAGIEDLGYLGNKGMAEFKVPADAVEYALKRSGLG